jgi:RHS repeat-associated protein
MGAELLEESGLVYPNGLSSNFTYDDLNRLKAVNAYQYQLGPTGNRQAATEPNGRTLNWTYDGIYRLTNETISLDPHAKNGAVDYGLDPVGNRNSQNSTLPGIPSVGSLTYDANDRLATETYDANGNTLTTGNRAFTYDFENHLKTMALDGGPVSVTLQYDGDGNRVAKIVGGATTHYLMDDVNPTGYAQVVEEIGSTGVQRTYTYGKQRISQNQLAGGTWTESFFGYDGGGSVRTLTGATRAVTDTYDYDAWGNATNTTGSTPNVYLYRSEQYDPDLRLNYLRARYLNPLSGRFLTRDRETGRIKLPVTLHKYLYVGADPVNWIDPLGRAGLLLFGIQSGGMVAFSPGPTTQDTKLCGGTFEFFGKELDAGEAGGFIGVIHEHDTVAGDSAGVLTEVWGGGEGAVLGGGNITSILGGNSENIGFIGTGLSGVFAGFQAGYVAGGSWGGFYVEGHLGSWALGTGAYLSTSCKK